MYIILKTLYISNYFLMIKSTGSVEQFLTKKCLTYIFNKE